MVFYEIITGIISLCFTGGSSAPRSASGRIVLVYFLGGCTFSEITALRFLGKLKGGQIFSFFFFQFFATIRNTKTKINRVSKEQIAIYGGLQCFTISLAGYRFIIATTSMMNGLTMIDTVLDKATT